jgi:hypothetical protein
VAWTDRYLDLSAGTNGDGLASSTPWNSFANAVTGLGTISAPMRVRVRGSGSLAANLSLNTAGTSGGNPLWWAGCDASWDILGEASDPLTGYPSLAAGTHQISITAGFQAFSYLAITGSATATNTVDCLTGTDMRFRRVSVTQTGTGSASVAFRLNAQRSLLLGCAFSATSSATSCLFVAGAGGDSAVVGCTVAGGNDGMAVQARALCAFNVVIGAAQDGISLINFAGAHLFANTVRAPGRDGIRVANAGTSIGNNLIVAANGAGAHPINFTGTATSGLNAFANGWFNVTNNSINGLVEQYHPFGIGLLASDPLADAAGGDYALASGSAAIGGGVPAQFLGLPSTLASADLGAAQQGGGGGGIFRRLARSIGV